MHQLIRVLGASLLGMSVLAAQGAQNILPTGTARVSGVVVDQATGAAVAGAAVSALGERREAGPRTTTGPDGRFVLEMLPALPVRIEVSKPASGNGAYGRKRRNGTGIPLTPGTPGTEEI